MSAPPDTSPAPASSEEGSPSYSRPGDEDYDLHAPAPWIAFLRKYIWVIGTLFFLVLITATRPFLIRRPAAPPVLTELPTVDLVDHDGERFGLEDMEGEVWVVGFVFTRCPSTCPAVSSAMLRFQEQVQRAQLDDHIHLLTVTVDPEYDRPDVLKEYATELGADLSHWRFVTGDSDAIEEFVVGGFKLAVGDRTEVAPGVFDIAHSTKLALVDRNGGVRGFWSIDDEGLNELFHRALATMRAKTPEENGAGQ